MKPLKILLVLLAVPVAVLTCAFGYGIYLEATGQFVHDEDAEQSQSAPPEPRAEKVKARVTERSLAEAGLPPLPQPLDDASALAWLAENGLVYVENESLRAQREVIGALPLEVATALYLALENGESDQTDALRLLFFALCGGLPKAARREFATEVGAVYPSSWFKGRQGYRGDFTRLFYMQTKDADSDYALGIRLYCEVLKSKEVTIALREFEAFNTDDSDGTWHIRVETKMDQFDAQTLRALADHIEPFGLLDIGEDRYLIARLREMADALDATGK